MTTKQQQAFDKWADEYIRRQYSFYNEETCKSVGAPLKRSLHEAWKAGIASISPPQISGLREAIDGSETGPSWINTMNPKAIMQAARYVAALQEGQ